MQEKAVRRMGEIRHFGIHCIDSEAAISLTYSGLWQPEPRNAPAGKPTHEAGRRVGESTARWRGNYYFIMRLISSL